MVLVILSRKRCQQRFSVGMCQWWLKLKVLLMKEEWKDVKEFEDLYQVSNMGRIKSLDRLVRHG